MGLEVEEENLNRFLQGGLFFFFFEGKRRRKEIFKLTAQIHELKISNSVKLININPNNTFMRGVMTIVLNRMRKKNYLKR